MKTKVVWNISPQEEVVLYIIKPIFFETLYVVYTVDMIFPC